MAAVYVATRGLHEGGQGLRLCGSQMVAFLWPVAMLGRLRNGEGTGVIAQALLSKTNQVLGLDWQRLGLAALAEHVGILETGDAARICQNSDR
jgi:hypothetical protein